MIEQLRETTRSTYLGFPIATGEDGLAQIREGELDLLVGYWRTEQTTEGCLCEVSRILKPGGRCVLVMPRPEQTEGTDLAAALREAGFDVSMRVARGEQDDGDQVVVLSATQGTRLPAARPVSVANRNHRRLGSQ